MHGARMRRSGGELALRLTQCVCGDIGGQQSQPETRLPTRGGGARAGGRRTRYARPLQYAVCDGELRDAARPLRRSGDARRARASRSARRIGDTGMIVDGLIIAALGRDAAGSVARGSRTSTKRARSRRRPATRCVSAAAMNGIGEITARRANSCGRDGYRDAIDLARVDPRRSAGGARRSPTWHAC